MSALGLCARWAHLGAGVFLVGTFAFLLLAGRSDRLTVVSWERTLTRWTRWAAGLLLLSGRTLPGSLRATQFGPVGLLRHGLLLLLAGLILLKEREESGWDWAAFRGEGLLLGGTGLGLLAWAGHGARV